MEQEAFEANSLVLNLLSEKFRSKYIVQQLVVAP